MELDDFKKRFSETMPESIILQSAGELEGYIRKRANSVIDKVKRSILFELLACIAFIAIAVWAWFYYNLSYVKAISMLSIFLCCCLLIYLGSLYKKISKYEKNTLTVKSGLQQVISILEQFTRVYFQFTMITLAIAFVVGLITGFITVHSDTAIINFHWQKAIFFYVGCFILWSALMYFFSKWYIKKLYGNYLLQLKEQLKEIENG
ncbi:MAG: hypothetical protein ABJB86_15075 [Bacteroidota bacterium]